MLRLPRSKKDAAREWLALKGQVTAADAQHLLDMAQGRVVAACLMANSESLAAKEALVASFPALGQQQGGPPASWSGVDVSVLLSELLAWVEDQVRQMDAEHFYRRAQSWL